MIRPNMATMLGFVATDAHISPALMRGVAKQLADQSFNRVTVDGDTSTNDSFVVMATGKAPHTAVSDWSSADGMALLDALMGVSRDLAHAIVRDGEVQSISRKAQPKALRLAAMRLTILRRPLLKAITHP